jgi:hypothetical protein
VRDNSRGGLFATLEAADAQHRESRGGKEGDWGGEKGVGETAVCPICGKFEGDERAVSHHVESHFA